MLTARSSGLVRNPVAILDGGHCLRTLTEGQARELMAQLHEALGDTGPWPDDVVETLPVPDAVRGRA